MTSIWKKAYDRVVLSENKMYLKKLNAFVISLIYIRKRRGPIMEP